MVLGPFELLVFLGKIVSEIKDFEVSLSSSEDSGKPVVSMHISNRRTLPQMLISIECGREKEVFIKLDRWPDSD